MGSSITMDSDTTMDRLKGDGLMPGTTEPNDVLIDRYLNRQMSEAETDAFEQRLFEDEQLFVRVQLLDAFKSALAEQGATLMPPRKALPPTFHAWFQQPFSRMAAVLVVGLALQVGYGLVSTGDASSAIGVDSTFVLEATRGSSELSLKGAPPYLFQVDAGFNAADTAVSVSLRKVDGGELLSVPSLPVDASGWARVLYAEPLSGRYSLELVNADGSTLREYDLRIND
jgi:hypothetical protein